MDKNAEKLSMLLGMPLKTTKGKPAAKKVAKSKGKKDAKKNTLPWSSQNKGKSKC